MFTELHFVRSSTASSVRSLTIVEFGMYWSEDADLLLAVVDVPMSRVKFNVNSEYAYIQNFKILQSMSSHGAALFRHA